MKNKLANVLVVLGLCVVIASHNVTSFINDINYEINITLDGVVVEFDDETHTVLLDSSSIKARHWRLFEFPYDLFTDEIIFITQYDNFSADATEIFVSGINVADFPSYLHFNSPCVLVKKVDNEWRQVPGMFRPFTGGVFGLGIGLNENRIIYSVEFDALLFDGLFPGTYRIATEAVIEKIETGEQEVHFVWAEFVVDKPMFYSQNLTRPENGVNVKLNGVIIEFEDDQRPFLMNDRTFLPVRTLVELVGVNVDYDETTHTVGLDTTYIVARQFPLFQFPGDYFTDEIKFEIKIDDPWWANIYLTNDSDELSYLRYNNFGLLLKQVGDEWRKLPIYPRLGWEYCYWIIEQGKTLEFFMNIGSIRDVFHEFAAGTYRIAIEVQLINFGSVEIENHWVWAEFEISS